MFKSLEQVEHRVGEKAFHFLYALDASLAEIKEAMSTMLGHVVNVEAKSKADAEAAAKAAAPVETEPPKE